MKIKNEKLSCTIKNGTDYTRLETLVIHLGKEVLEYYKGGKKNENAIKAIRHNVGLINEMFRDKELI